MMCRARKREAGSLDIVCAGGHAEAHLQKGAARRGEQAAAEGAVQTWRLAAASATRTSVRAFSCSTYSLTTAAIAAQSAVAELTRMSVLKTGANLSSTISASCAQYARIRERMAKGSLSTAALMPCSATLSKLACCPALKIPGSAFLALAACLAISPYLKIRGPTSGYPVSD